MKKYFIILLFSFLLFGCNNQKNDYDILLELSQTISLPTEANDNLELPTTYEIQNVIVNAIWETEDTEHISTNGEIFQDVEDYYASLKLTLTLNDESLVMFFDITILAIDQKIYAQNILDTITVPEEINNHIELPSFTTYNDNTYKISWESSNPTYISNSGIINYAEKDRSCTLTAYISYNKTEYSKNFDILIKKFNTTEMNNFLNDFFLPSETNEDLLLPGFFTGENTYKISWCSSDENIISSDGEIGYVLNECFVELNCQISIGEIAISKTYSIKVLPTSPEIIYNKIVKNLNIFTTINKNINLPTSFGNNISCVWNSSDTNILTNEGEILHNNCTTPEYITLLGTFYIGDEIMTHEYNLIINYTPHFYKTNVFDGSLQNLKLNKEGNLILLPGATEGTYISKEIETKNFKEAVASWCAITSENATCEVLISVKVNGNYSDYISYGEWGLGLQNKCYDQKNNLAELSTDEIKILNGKSAEAFKYKVVMRRENSNIQSPEFYLFAIALLLVDNNYSIDDNLLKPYVLHDVPKLYQHDVPVIGNSICSATSSTMLLKYAGYSFTDQAALEHEYIAKIVKDYGNNIFGNWVYNTVGISSFGLTSYVKRFVDTNEFLYSIQEMGPMAASIKGTVKYTKTSTGESGSYTSGGHLLVVTGYEITENETYIFINDPNVKTVSIKMSLNDFLTIWRNVSYIIDK